MDFVRSETLQNPTEDKDVLHFVDDHVKPLILNVTNKRVLIAGYGDESDDWHGKPVEIYVDPNVTNARQRVVGGIRVRIPTGPAPIGNRPSPPTGVRNGAAPLAASAVVTRFALIAPRYKRKRPRGISARPQQKAASFWPSPVISQGQPRH